MSPPKQSDSYGSRLLNRLFFLKGKRIFSMPEIIEAAEELNIPRAQLNIIISNLAKRGELLRLRRGLYVGIGLLPAREKTHEFVISSFLVQPSAISHWSAAQYHGLTEQLPLIVTASTPTKIITPTMRKGASDKTKRKKYAWEIDNIRYEYMLVQEKHFNLGLEKIWIDEFFNIWITDRERTLLDIFNNSKMFGGMSGALTILENALGEIDVTKLVQYAIDYGKKSLAKRIGWALEYFGVSDKDLTPLLNISINHYCRLDPNSEAVGSCNKRWMIQNNLIT